MSEPPDSHSVSPHDGRVAGSPLDVSGVWAAMSHEIRTPLMGVVGMLEILARTALTDEQRRIIATAGESSSALMRIVDDVLDLAKLESARGALTPVATDLVEVLEGCAEILANHAETKALAVTCEIGADVPPVICDALRLRQVLLNLGINAVKFTDAGHVALSVQTTAINANAVHLRFTITDSGIGIPAELHAFLFQPFSQLAVAAGRGLGGVGLGLAICRSLVEAMSGKITVDSAPGRGTCFAIDVRFPLAERRLESMVQLNGVKVLAVDAGEPALQIALRYLRAAGADVQRVGALGTLGSNSLVRHLAQPAGEGERLVVVIGPDAEAEDVRAATANLEAGGGRGRIPVLWLHPRAVGGASTLARRGVHAVRAHPLRRAALLAAVTAARPTDAEDAPVLTRRLESAAFGSGDEEAAATARADGRVVLVAEDNIVNQQVLRQQLAILGFDCDIAAQGTAALQLLRERSYLLLLCDCHMPGMDGFELTRQIREAEAGSGQRLPIVAITANAIPGEAGRCRAAGMDDYLAKPIEISGLRVTLERWLDAGWHRLAAAGESGGAVTVKPLGASQSAIDLKNLQALFGNDVARLRPVLDQWRSVIGDSAVILKASLAERRWTDAANAVHRIKGSAGIAGAHGLSVAAGALEEALRKEDPALIAKEGGQVLSFAANALAEAKLWDVAAPQAAFSAASASVASR